MNEIDELMSKDPLSMTTNDIAAIVQYHRNNRANSTDGKKPVKPQGPKVDLSELMGTKSKVGGAKLRRI